MAPRTCRRASAGTLVALALVAALALVQTCTDEASTSLVGGLFSSTSEATHRRLQGYVCRFPPAPCAPSLPLITLRARPWQWYRVRADSLPHLCVPRGGYHCVPDLPLLPEQPDQPADRLRTGAQWW